MAIEKRLIAHRTPCHITTLDINNLVYLWMDKKIELIRGWIMFATTAVTTH